MVIELKLYDDENETRKTLREWKVPWELMKRATKLQAALKEDNLIEAMDDVMDVVAELFHRQATREEIVAGADSADILTCFRCMIQGVTIEANRNFIRAVKAAKEDQ